MNIFEDYARYYDLLYKDKDYVGEAHFIQKILQAHAPNAHNLLDLGCGTGAHAVLLAKQGYQLHGVDISTKMLRRAQDRLAQLSPDVGSRFEFTQGDIRQVRLNQTFDAVLSLFHVMSYQSTNEDLRSAFATVKEHLNPAGVFIFDVWYGAAVLSDPPTVKVKRLEDKETIVTRVAEPVMYPSKNWVDVNYQIFVRDKVSNTVQELQETHRMRYLFESEIELILQEMNMEILDAREWMTDRDPGFDTWGVYFVVRQGGVK
jgi:ubiquinone/menaquinone biosynthesis C-methylase UbiE